MTSDLISTNDAVTPCTRMYGFTDVSTDVQIPCRISGRKSMVISFPFPAGNSNARNQSTRAVLLPGCAQNEKGALASYLQEHTFDDSFTEDTALPLISKYVDGEGNYKFPCKAHTISWVK